MEFAESSSPRGDWLWGGDSRFCGWLELFLDEAYGLPDRTKVCCKEVGHDRFTVFVDAFGLKYEERGECLVSEHR